MSLRRHRVHGIASSALGALLVFSAAGAFAQQLSLNNTRGLDFGRFAAAGGGTVILGPTGLRSRTGAVVLLNSPDAGQAIFNATRANGDKTQVSISLPVDGSVRLASGANTMAVNNFTSSPAATMSIQTPMTLGVGATLTVAPDQARGNYSGTFSVTVNYQ